MHGLLALMELQASRLPARTGAGRLEPVLLPTRTGVGGTGCCIRRGLAGLTRAEQIGRPLGPYVIQADIAACHARAAQPQDTDWARIADLYAVLASIWPSPVVELNRAVAVSYSRGPAAGLEVLGEVLTAGQLADYPYLHAVHADLLERAGRRTEASAASNTPPPQPRRPNRTRDLHPSRTTPRPQPPLIAHGDRRARHGLRRTRLSPTRPSSQPSPSCPPSWRTGWARHTSGRGGFAQCPFGGSASRGNHRLGRTGANVDPPPGNELGGTSATAATRAFANADVRMLLSWCAQAQQRTGRSPASAEQTVPGTRDLRWRTAQTAGAGTVEPMTDTADPASAGTLAPRVLPLTDGRIVATLETVPALPVNRLSGTWPDAQFTPLGMASLRFPLRRGRTDPPAPHRSQDDRADAPPCPRRCCAPTHSSQPSTGSTGRAGATCVARSTRWRCTGTRTTSATWPAAGCTRPITLHRVYSPPRSPSPLPSLPRGGPC